jgi:hypothetical protein
MQAVNPMLYQALKDLGAKRPHPKDDGAVLLKHTSFPSLNTWRFYTSVIICHLHDIDLLV